MDHGQYNESLQKHCVLKYRKLASMHPSYNFMFTREPIHRLYSCWKDKIYKREGHQYYYEKANKKIFLSEGRAEISAPVFDRKFI